MHVQPPTMYYQHPAPLPFAPQPDQQYSIHTSVMNHYGATMNPYAHPSPLVPVTENHRRTRVKRRIWPPGLDDSYVGSGHSTPDFAPTGMTHNVQTDASFW
ncbi:hypothetical protein TWF679_006449 [Orbilia oligospora]|uniref:Uncharacterized protein n=1 Tax=Orbilia oligospora TaxID=2813651 RepID=A0A8H8V9R1_ORBOL|nr:hypothetical protein TWF679_006449 [Orbilia oligospora]